LDGWKEGDLVLIVEDLVAGSVFHVECDERGLGHFGGLWESLPDVVEQGLDGAGLGEFELGEIGPAEFLEVGKELYGNGHWVGCEITSWGELCSRAIWGRFLNRTA